MVPMDAMEYRGLMETQAAKDCRVRRLHMHPTVEIYSTPDFPLAALISSRTAPRSAYCRGASSYYFLVCNYMRSLTALDISCWAGLFKTRLTLILA